MASVVINTRFNNRKAEADLKELQAKANASLAAANSNNTTGNRNWNGSAGVADLSITPYIIYCTV